MKMTDQIKAFVAERDEVLRSLDPERVMAFHAKVNPDLPRMSREVAEIAMHKARVHDLNLTEDERRFSTHWLESRGYRADFEPAVPPSRP